MAQAAEIREVIVQLKDQQRDKASISETVHTVKVTHHPHNLSQHVMV